MSLAEAFANAIDTPATRPHRINVILDKLTPADRDALKRYLADPLVPSATIATVLRQNGHQVADSTVAMYRRKFNATQ